jgi:hypothetical protein
MGGKIVWEKGVEIYKTEWAWRMRVFECHMDCFLRDFITDEDLVGGGDSIQDHEHTR